MTRFLSILFLLFFTASDSKALPLPLDLHEYHISQCQIQYNAKEKALQITMHLFIDDLEEALRIQGADKLFICTEKESEKAEKYMARYLRQAFQLEVNDIPMAYEFLGKEPSEDLQGVWCYLEITDVNELTSLVVSNDLLLEVFDDQKNIVQIATTGGKQGYFMFVKGKTSDKVTF